MTLALAVLAGFFVWTVLWLASNALWRRIDPAAYDLERGGAGAVASLRVLAVAAFLSLLAGWIAAIIAGAWTAVWILIVLQLVAGAIVTATSWRVAPWWYHAAFLAMLAPLHVAGARIVLA